MLNLAALGGRTGRWATLATGAAMLVVTAAGTASAQTVVGANATGTFDGSGQITLYGSYVCDPGTSPYAQIEVYASQPTWDGDQATAVTYDNLQCTGTEQTWQETLTTAPGADPFSAGVVTTTVTLWTPGEWNDGSQIVQNVYVS